MEFLRFSNGSSVLDESLVKFALKTYYDRFGRKPPLARVHPTMVTTMQAILAHFRGKLDVVANGGTLSTELELAKPLPEQPAPAQLILRL